MLNNSHHSNYLLNDFGSNCVQSSLKQANKNYLQDSFYVNKIDKKNLLEFLSVF